MGKALPAFFLILPVLAGPVYAQGTPEGDPVALSRADCLESVAPPAALARSPLMILPRQWEGLTGPSWSGVSPGWDREPSGKRAAGITALSRQQADGRRRGWVKRHPVLFGALTGAAGGAVLSMTMENELFCSGGDEDCLFHGGSGPAVGAGMGAGAGALVGWFASQGRR